MIVALPGLFSYLFLYKAANHHCLVKLVNWQSSKQRKGHTSQQILTVQSSLSTKTVLQTKEGPYKPANPLSIKLVQQTKEVPYKPANPHCPVKLVHQDSPANKGRAIQASKSSLSSQACSPRQTSQPILSVFSSLSTKQTKEVPYKPANPQCLFKLVNEDRPANKGRAIQASKSSLSSQPCQVRQSRNRPGSQSSLSSQACPPRQSNKQKKCHKKNPEKPHCPVKTVHQDSPRNKRSAIQTSRSSLSSQACQLTVQQTKEGPYKPANPNCPVKLVHQDSPANKGRATHVQASKSSLSSQACPPRKQILQTKKGPYKPANPHCPSSLSTKTIQQTKEVPYKPANLHCLVKLVNWQSSKQRKGHTSQQILAV